jgi:hypothetical protein
MCLLRSRDGPVHSTVTDAGPPVEAGATRVPSHGVLTGSMIETRRGPPMVHIELSDADAAILREMLAHKLHDIAIEINRTDSLEFKKMLRQTEHALDRLMRQLPEKSAARET